LAFEAVNRFQEDFFHSILDCKEYFEEVKAAKESINKIKECIKHIK
jgi:hypothetical protein